MPVVMVNNYSNSSKINKIMLLAALTTHSGNWENRKHLPLSQPMSRANRSSDVNGFYSLLPLLRLFLKSLFPYNFHFALWLLPQEALSSCFRAVSACLLPCSLPWWS